MLTETGRVVAVEETALWVQTIRKSACGQCSAQKGCGQAVLSKFGSEVGYLKVDLNGRDPSRYRLDDTVTIAIGETVFLKSSLIIYLLPLLFLMAFIGLGEFFQLSELLSVGLAVIGLLMGGVVTRWVLSRVNRRESIEPILLDTIAPSAC